MDNLTSHPGELLHRKFVFCTKFVLFSIVLQCFENKYFCAFNIQSIFACCYVYVTTLLLNKPIFLKVLIILLFFFKFYLFWQGQVFMDVQGLSLAEASVMMHLDVVHSLPLWWFLLLQNTGSSFGTWAHELWSMSLVTLQHVGSSQTSITGKLTINQWITRVVLNKPRLFRLEVWYNTRERTTS